MSKIQEVDALPVLGNLGEFPEIPKHTVLTLVGTEWGSSAKEIVVASLIQFCTQKGQWVPVGAVDFVSELNRRHIFKLFGQKVINNMWQMVEDGELSVVQLPDGTQHLVLTSATVQKALTTGRVMYDMQ